MAATPSSKSKSSDGDAVPLTFEENLYQFWQKYRTIILALVAFVLVAILVKYGWEGIQRQREGDLEAEYRSATTPDQLRAFANAHPGHELAGIAALEVADQAYTAGRAADAATEYDKAVNALKAGPLASRARLGRALAEVQSGKVSDGQAELKQLADDASLLNAIRAEAAYYLASLAVDSNNAADAQKYVEQLNQIDPTSIWARRAVALQASLPPAGSSAAPGAPSSSSSTSAATTGPSVQVKLPGK